MYTVCRPQYMSFGVEDRVQTAMENMNLYSFASLNDEMDRLQQGLENDRYNTELFAAVRALGPTLLTVNSISANNQLTLRMKHSRLVEFYQIDRELVELKTELLQNGPDPTIEYLQRVRNLLVALGTSAQLTDDDRFQLHSKHAYVLDFYASKVWILDFHDYYMASSDIKHDSSYASDDERSDSHGEGENDTAWLVDSDNEWVPEPSSYFMQRG